MWVESEKPYNRVGIILNFNYIMKKLSIVSISLACVLLATSCHKKESTVVTESTYSKELALSKKFGYTGGSTSSATHRTTDAENIIGHDAAGAAYGAYYGMMFAGPWGALCGSIAFGGYVSMAVYDDIAVKNVNPTTGVTLSNNPYEYIGQLHNALLQSFLVNYGKPINSNTMYSAYQFDSTYVDSNISGFTTNYTSVFTQGWNSVTQYNFDPIACMTAMYNNKQIDANFYNMWNLNYSTILQFANSYSAAEAVDSIEAYYPQFVTIVMQSTDLSANDKQFILTTAAVNAYEAIYHIVNNN